MYLNHKKISYIIKFAIFVYFNFSTWTNVGNRSDSGWPDNAEDNKEGWPNNGSNPQSNSSSSAFASDLVPEFEPGKPWKVSLHIILRKVCYGVMLKLVLCLQYFQQNFFLLSMIYLYISFIPNLVITCYDILVFLDCSYF